MTRTQIRSSLPGIYVLAILIAVFTGGGRAVGAVAVIGAVALGITMNLLRPSCAEGRGRDRSARYQRRYGRDKGDDDIQDT